MMTFVGIKKTIDVLTNLSDGVIHAVRSDIVGDHIPDVVAEPHNAHHTLVENCHAGDERRQAGPMSRDSHPASAFKSHQVDPFDQRFRIKSRLQIIAVQAVEQGVGKRQWRFCSNDVTKEAATSVRVTGVKFVDNRNEWRERV